MVTLLVLPLIGTVSEEADPLNAWNSWKFSPWTTRKFAIYIIEAKYRSLNFPDEYFILDEQLLD